MAKQIPEVTKKISRWFLPVSILIVLLSWYLLAELGSFPSFILPSPADVATRFCIALSDGSLLRNLGVTLYEVLLGLTCGGLVATILGYLLAKSRVLDLVLSPYLVASQAIPIVAIAPVLVIWFGPGMISKVLICAMIVFFPVLINTVVGLRAVPDNLRDLLRSMQAKNYQILTNLEIPAAMPVFLGGVRVGATLSVMGAVVGEFVGADRGLGFLINVGRGQYDTALVFVAIFTLVIMALLLYGLVVLAEKRFLRWQGRN